MCVVGVGGERGEERGERSEGRRSVCTSVGRRNLISTYLGGDSCCEKEGSA